MSLNIIDINFFIKKILFKTEEQHYCELISLNKETIEKGDSGTSSKNVTVLSSHYRELPEGLVLETMDLKKYISEEEANHLFNLETDESAFLEYTNNLIQ